VVTTISGAIVSLVEVSWGVTEAAVIYPNHLAHEAAVIGGDILARTVAKLAIVGQALLTALDQFLTVIMEAVERSIDTALGPFFSLEQSYGLALDEAVNPSGATAVWDAIGGSIFLIGFIVALVLETAIVVISCFSLGSTFLVNILIGALIGVGLTFLMAALPTLTSPSSAMVNTLDSFAGEYASQGQEYENWTSWANAFAYWEGGPSNEYAAIQLTVAWSNPQLSQAASFAFALLSFTMASYGGAGGGMSATNSAVVLDAVSVLLELASLKKPAGLAQDLSTMDLTIAGFDTVALGIDIGEWDKGE
jgi:hypothetical protein